MRHRRGPFTSFLHLFDPFVDAGFRYRGLSRNLTVVIGAEKPLRNVNTAVAAVIEVDDFAAADVART